MPPINILIKPASSACNMACQYCFYKDVAAHREQEFEGMLSIESIEKVIQAGMEYAEHICSFAFQGGEPTLAGLDFYRQVVVLQKQYAKPGVEIRNAIQTNGYTIDEEWAAFFRENHFLVGLSLDGPPELHNRNLTDVQGKDTFNRVMKSVRLLKKHNVAFNILCVVTGQNARSVEKLYRFYRKQNFRWLQFIPCIDPFDRADGEPCYTLTADGYGDFLVRLFDLWFDDLRHGEYISIRHLDNWLSILLGERPEACNMAGCCSVQFVVEGDGGVYPCDFYVLDEWRLGNIRETGLADMQNSETAKRFVRQSLAVPEECKTCQWFGLCRNGCRRDRDILPNGVIGQNIYCTAYKKFFSERFRQLAQSIECIQRMQHR